MFPGYLVVTGAPMIDMVIGLVWMRATMGIPTIGLVIVMMAGTLVVRRYRRSGKRERERRRRRKRIKWSMKRRKRIKWSMKKRKR